MSQEIYKKKAAMIIKNNLDFVEKRDFSALFEIAFNVGTGFAPYIIGAIGEILTEAGIDFLKYIDKVPSYAFFGTNITKLVIPNSVNRINSYAFKNCADLKKLVIPKSVTLFASNCFSDCPKLDLIEYKGTLREWKVIVKSPSYHDGCGDIMLMCSDQATMLHSD